MMTLDELIGRLEEIREIAGGDADVVLAVQPNYPLRETLRGVAFAEDVLPDLHEEHEDREDPMDCAECAKLRETVWLVSGGQSSSYGDSPYAPAWVMENASA